MQLVLKIPFWQHVCPPLKHPLTRSTGVCSSQVAVSENKLKLFPAPVDKFLSSNILHTNIPASPDTEETSLDGIVQDKITQAGDNDSLPAYLLPTRSRKITALSAPSHGRPVLQETTSTVKSILQCFQCPPYNFEEVKQN